MARRRIPAGATPPLGSICKTCARTLATTSPDGGFVLSGTHNQACNTCEMFEVLYEDAQRRDDAFKELESRRFEHGGRQLALAEAKAAHKAFNNFLIQVEAQPMPSASSEDPSQSATLQEAQDSFLSHKQDQKRALTPSTPPKAKRPRLDHGTHRVSFHPSVIFRDETDARPYHVFNRSSDEYVPGRNAPREPSEFLDTSGYGVPPGRFFGVRKHGKGWVETKEGREMDEWWRAGGEVGKEEGTEIEKGVEAGDEAEVSSGGTRSESAMVDGDGNANDLKLEQSEPLTTEEEGDIRKVPPQNLSEQETAGQEQLQTQPEPLNRSPDRPNQASAPKPVTTEHITKQPPSEISPVQDTEKNWTYGFGWNKKLSPNSRPRGIQWKPGLDESLPQSLKRDLVKRGRGYPKVLRDKETQL